MFFVGWSISNISDTLLTDTFSSVSSTNWHIPTWTSSTDGTFIGRTQFKCTQNASLPTASNGNAVISLNTYNPTGASFYANEIISNKTFSVDKGIDISIRAKMNTTVPGIVGGIFLYSLKPGSNTLHDEIDFELLTNRPNEVQTNIYANEPLGAGSPQFVSLVSGSISDYHTYQIKWQNDKVTWLIDGVVARTETRIIPAGPMSLYFNIWAPDAGWAAAYSSALNYVTSSSLNKVYSMLVDSVAVDTIIATPVLKTISLTPATDTLVIGGATGQLTASPLDQNGNPISAVVTWSSSNSSVAKVSSTGVVTPVYPGTANIYASSGGIKSNAAAMTVVRAKLTNINLSPTSLNFVSYGATQPITATKIDENGKPIAATLTWTSSDTAVAKVSTTGVVSPQGIGTATITASSDGITSNAVNVNVVYPSIQITSVPALGATGYAKGKVIGLVYPNYAKYKVAVYINVVGGWWNKPTWSAPLTSIQSLGAWSANIVTGGSDQNARQISAYLLPAGVAAPLLKGESSLPSSLDQYPHASINR